jgi:hypothetical protein
MEVVRKGGGMPLWQQIAYALGICGFTVAVLVCIGLAAEQVAKDN